MSDRPIHHSAFITHHSAFTLMEVMIAIGILGIGAVLAASLFPAAVKESNTSYEKSIGTLICQHGYAIACAKYKAGNLPPGGNLAWDTSLGAVDTCYPTPYLPQPGSPAAGDASWIDDGGVRPRTLKGHLILGRQIGSEGGLIVIVAFKKTENGYSNTVEAVDITISNPVVRSDGKTAMDVTSGSSDLPLGSAVIFKNSGEHGYIEAVDGTSIVLDRTLNKSGSAYTIVEKDGPTVLDVNPVLMVQSFRTSLLGGS